MPHLPDFDPPTTDHWDGDWSDREFDLFGDAMSSDYGDNSLACDLPSPPEGSVNVARNTVRSREMHWRCCHCWSDSWKWNSVAKCWRCVKCYGVDFVEVSSPVQQPLSEHDVSALASGRLPATAFGPPPSDDGADGGERGESEHGTNDPVVDPDTLQTTPNRRRRRRPKRLLLIHRISEIVTYN